MLLLIKLIFMFQTLNLNEYIHYRTLLEESVNSSSRANILYKETRKFNSSSPSVLLGFKAMSDLIMCNHVFSPLSKMSYFASGKNLLEDCIKKDPGNIELRFYRFSTQCNAPALLNYSANIKEDKNILLTFLKLNQNTPDQDLYKRVKNFMLTSSSCSVTEKQLLQSL